MSEREEVERVQTDLTRYNCERCGRPVEPTKTHRVRFVASSGQGRAIPSHELCPRQEPQP